jgi:hypothetical protein
MPDYKTLDYKAMYYGLYRDVAYLLVSNEEDAPKDRRDLLNSWDHLRSKYDKVVIESKALA